MARELLRALLATIVLTVVLGLAYPLAMTAVAQLALPGKADGSLLRDGGRVVGSELLARPASGRPGDFQPRPSQTEWAAGASAFLNLGPNQRELADLFARRRDAYARREGVPAARVPVDAVANSASGVDPLISKANARIQARRVARARALALRRVLALVDAHTDRRDLGVLGEPGVNVTTLNRALG